jgi:hypothetical protein
LFSEVGYCLFYFDRVQLSSPLWRIPELVRAIMKWLIFPSFRDQRFSVAEILIPNRRSSVAHRFAYPHLQP